MTAIVWSPRANVRGPGCPGKSAHVPAKVTADREQDVDEILKRLRCLGGRSYSVERLSGGLTNLNLKVTAGPETLVVRISHPDSGLLAIDRDAEYRNSLAAAGCGVGAPVIEYRPDLNTLVVGFIQARTCSRTDLDDGDRLERVVRACRVLHAGPRFDNQLDMFALQTYYLAVIMERGYRLPVGYLDFLPGLERIRAAFAATEEATVPCHNDLLAENCLDDGARVWLIDYEYAGNNDPCFELGNLWSESDLSLEHLDQIVTSYFGVPDPQKKARARLQGLVSKYVWMLWAAIQDTAAPIDFDFWSWGMEKYDRAVTEFTSPGFGALLDAAAGR
jgi:thiamine kinase-like enzyme